MKLVFIMIYFRVKNGHTDSRAPFGESPEVLHIILKKLFCFQVKAQI